MNLNNLMNTAAFLYALSALDMGLKENTPEADKALAILIETLVKARNNSIRVTGLLNDAIIAAQNKDIATVAHCYTDTLLGDENESK